MELFNTDYSTITPAYGRDYKSQKAFIADFNANKDFNIETPFQSILINKEQIEPGTKLQGRFSSMRKTFVFESKQLLD